MCFDVVREGKGLWFPIVEESRAKLPYTCHGIDGHRFHLEDLAPLLIWQGLRGVLRPQKSKVYFHTAGPQYEATQMDGVPRGLRLHVALPS